jgi:hypothetical protein
MLIHVHNIKLTCDWHEAIKLNYSTTGTDVIFVIRVSKRYRLADADVTLLNHSQPEASTYAAYDIGKNIVSW